ncbi:hypothetical protein [Pararobbsia alpina]|uniref:hypothetical protein n=1 Tax=Pararobbsia alpina TaxID=621374 RepID=UPI0031B64A63
MTKVLPNHEGYELTIFKPLADSSSENDVVDARRMNKSFEEQILKLPEQYYWCTDASNIVCQACRRCIGCYASSGVQPEASVPAKLGEQ